MTTIKDSIDFLKGYCQFSPNEVYMLEAIVRNKDAKTPTEKANKWMRRLILRSTEDIPMCYHDLKAMGDVKDVTYRMYVSFNSRDVLKALFNFQPILITMGYDLASGRTETLDRIKRLDSAWKTELHQSHNRGTKRFLLDCDFKDEKTIEMFVKELNAITTVHALRETVNGWHIVFDACDLRKFSVEHPLERMKVELHRDSLLFVEAWEGQGE